MKLSLKEALDRLDLPAVWDMARNPNGTSPPSRAGVMKSPLREDHHGASFSVGKDLRVFKDHAVPEHKGGVWQFVALCRPDWDKRAIAREIITRAGGDPDAKDPDWKPENRARWQSRVDEAMESAHAARRALNMKEPVVEAHKCGPASARARGAWLKLSQEAAAVEDLASERAWPIEWVEALCEMDLLRFRTTRSGLEPSFAVELLKDGSRVWLGSHSRWRPDRNAKAWAYSPKGIAAAPFVLGSPAAAPVWVVTEGQWDAVTAYGLLGGFDDGSMRMEACCWGVRGAEGADVWLGLYGSLLRKFKPAVILIPDADAAGRRWTVDSGKARWSLLRRLRNVYGVAASALEFEALEGCKDLNDFYREGLNTEMLLNAINE